MDSALQGFSHPASEREFKWDLARAGWIRDKLDYVKDEARRKQVERLLELFETEVVPALPSLRSSVIHNDANDYNVLIDERGGRQEIATVIDFGDLVHTRTVFEVAISAAYALFRTPKPLESAAQVVAGYHSVLPLEEKEVALLYPLICMRLCVSVVNSTQRRTVEPDDPYVYVSEADGWAALEQLTKFHPRFAYYRFRQACGLPPVPQSEAVAEWLQKNAADFAPVLDVELTEENCLVLDNSVGSRLLGANPASVETEKFTEILFGEMKAKGARVGIGRYDEARMLYTSDAFATGEHPTDERRTIHLGIDLFVPPGSPVFAPLAGEVACVANNAAGKDYGPLIILKHKVGEGPDFYTLYGHLTEDSLEGVSPGQRVKQGQRIARIGAPPANGDWPPHLHFQIITDLLEMGRDFPGVGFASEREIWRSLSPDPNVMLRIPAECFPPPEEESREILAARRQRLGRNLSFSYRTPVKIVRGWMQYLYDETGRAYLDAFNNVPHVGHSHPRVVQAAQEQMALLNTNTRYLHENITRYAERLSAALPGDLSVCYFVNSGSEANELALRLARAHTRQENVIVLEGAYHGTTTTLTDVSPYKFNGPGGTGAKPWVHTAPLPDDFRGPFKRNDPKAGRKYAEQVAELVEGITARREGLAAFLHESAPSVGGQILFPPGYLKEAYAHVRGAGGVCIADEVQVGFGRLGTNFWGFETQAIVPDIVVLGKPMGNGHPLGAVITTKEIAESFDNGMEFFSTFGGNPVSCAVGLAVLEVVQEEKLQAHALAVGKELLAGLQDLKQKYPIIGDVRGSGFFLGVELVLDQTTLEPAPAEATYVVNRLRERGILTGIDGPHENVIKVRPPMPFNQADAERLLEVLEEVLQEDGAGGAAFVG
jgi:4-aminobutyrate aminotransferase-like enzyme